ncbi:hypothetical protein GQ457_14G019110 [Hibiscus cannabinus]
MANLPEVTDHGAGGNMDYLSTKFKGLVNQFAKLTHEIMKLEEEKNASLSRATAAELQINELMKEMASLNAKLLEMIVAVDRFMHFTGTSSSDMSGLPSITDRGVGGNIDHLSVQVSSLLNRAKNLFDDRNRLQGEQNAAEIRAINAEKRNAEAENQLKAQNDEIGELKYELLLGIPGICMDGPIPTIQFRET